MKKTKKVATLMLSLLICSVMSVGVVSTLDAAADKNADSYAIFSAESVFAYEICLQQLLKLLILYMFLMRMNLTSQM